MRINITRKNDLMVSYDVVNGWTIVEIDGEVDAHTASILREALIALYEQGHRHFVFDLGFVTFLDSVGLGVIIAITKRVRESRGSVLIASASGLILRIFHLSGLNQTYEFHTSQREATLRRPPD